MAAGFMDAALTSHCACRLISLTVSWKRLSEIGEVTNKQQSAMDITDQYTDTDSRIAVLEERKNRLMTHLQNATETEDVIAIENQLADTIYELEQLQGSKRHMDNVVDYATVSVSLTELITPETIGSDGQPLGDRASDAFAMSMSGVGEFMENFAIFWAAAAPVLIPDRDLRGDYFPDRETCAFPDEEISRQASKARQAAGLPAAALYAAADAPHGAAAASANTAATAGSRARARRAQNG